MAAQGSRSAKGLFVPSVKRNIALLHGHDPYDLTFEGTVGIYGWRGIPAEIQNRISTDVQAITSDPAFRSRMARPARMPAAEPPAEFAAAIEEQRVKIAAINMTIQPPAR
jgi:tripartite-type tricarboxylate transporter receptor subunit TctC